MTEPRNWTPPHDLHYQLSNGTHFERGNYNKCQELCEKANEVRGRTEKTINRMPKLMLELAIPSKKKKENTRMPSSSTSLWQSTEP
jgi:hypothetical protein